MNANATTGSTFLQFRKTILRKCFSNQFHSFLTYGGAIVNYGELIIETLHFHQIKAKMVGAITNYNN